MVEKRVVKLAGKILNNPKDVNFEELRRLLEGFGYECRQPRSGSSHYIFRIKGSMPISVPKDKPVNKKYVAQVVELLNLEEWYEENR